MTLAACRALPRTALQPSEKLDFAGVQLVAVSQAIDSRDDQADVLMTVHGLVDSLYVKELRKKVHNGLDERALRGLHTGGRCYGYSTKDTEGGKRVVVNEIEAAVVRRIFQLSAGGCSLKTIAKNLNSEAIAAPRPRRDRLPETGVRKDGARLPFGKCFAVSDILGVSSGIAPSL